MNRKKAVLDADFVRALCECRSDNFFVDFMDAIDRQPVLSWYVANQELFDCQKIKELIDQEIVKVIYPGHFLHDETERTLFSLNVRSINEKVNSTTIPQSVDVLSDTFHVSGKNLGEIISELMAQEMNIEFFASNDWGAKRCAQDYINSDRFCLQVRNLGEILELIAKQGKCHLLRWSDVKHLLAEDRWKKIKNRLREYWLKDERQEV